MKKILLFLVAVMVFGSAFGEVKMLTCSRSSDISDKIKSLEEGWCNEKRFLEISAPEIFSFELSSLNQENIDEISLDNVNNSNVLAEVGTLNLREHRLCLEEICHSMWSYCNAGKTYSTDNEQISWCEKTVKNFFEIGKISVKTAVSGNQKRKSRSSVEEKFRAIEVRMQQYFKPNLISFVEEFKRFTEEKVKAFILNPLQ